MRISKQTASMRIWARGQISALPVKGGYEYQHYRTNYDNQNFSNTENIGSCPDVTPVNWFLGRLTYLYGDRDVGGYTFDPTTMLPQSIKYMLHFRTRNRVDAFLQFSPWETISTSLTGGYAVDDYRDNLFGLPRTTVNIGVNVS